MGSKPAASNDWSSLDHHMIQDDVSWLQSVLISSEVAHDWQGVLGLGLAPHSARIVHESLQLLRRKNKVGVKQVELEYPREVAAARHAIKLLDDTAKSYEDVLSDFEQMDTDTGGSPIDPRAFAIATRDHRIYSTTRVAAFYGISTAGTRPRGENSREYKVAFDMGRAASRVLRAFNMKLPDATAIPMNGTAPTAQGRNRVDYLNGRFEPNFPTPLKDLLTVVESSVNVANDLLEPCTEAFTSSLFRIRMVVVTHAINTLREVIRRHEDITTHPPVSAIASIVNSEDAARIGELRALRNRCMHYGIPGNLNGLSTKLPVYGLVEATSPGTSFDEVDAALRRLLTRISDGMRDWSA